MKRFIFFSCCMYDNEKIKMLDVINTTVNLKVVLIGSRMMGMEIVHEFTDINDHSRMVVESSILI